MKPDPLVSPPASAPSAQPKAAEVPPDLKRMSETERIALLEGISPRRQAFNRWVIRVISRFLKICAQQWLLGIIVILGLVIGGAFLVPVLFYYGLPDLGEQLFQAYHAICDQIPSHSYFLFGYQLGLCARTLAIYGSLLIGSLAFHFMRRWLPPLDWRLWLLLLLPMALDGGTQLVGWRESTWELRTLTGILFGFACCWFVLPRIEEMTRELPLTGQVSRSDNRTTSSLFPRGGPA